MISLTSVNYLHLVDLFRIEMLNLIAARSCCLKKGSLQNYVSMLKALYREPGMSNRLMSATQSGINNWHSQIVAARAKRGNVPVSLSAAFGPVDALIDSLSNPKYKNSDYKSVYRKFITYICSCIDGSARIELMFNDEKLMQFIASSAMYASTDVVESVVFGKCGSQENKKAGGNKEASWYCCMWQRKTGGQTKGTLLTKNHYNLNVMTDDNTKANIAIKSAVKITLSNTQQIKLENFRDFNDYVACHLWDGQSLNSGNSHRSTAYDHRFFTSLTNLVLIPSVLAGITDHHPQISECLRIRAYELYKDIPGVIFPGAIPTKPSWYNKIIWR